MLPTRASDSHRRNRGRGVRSVGPSLGVPHRQTNSRGESCLAPAPSFLSRDSCLRSQRGIRQREREQGRGRNRRDVLAAVDRVGDRSIVELTSKIPVPEQLSCPGIEHFEITDVEPRLIRPGAHATTSTAVVRRLTTATQRSDRDRPIVDREVGVLA
jgi:hypothetical protein